ncbi:MAG: PLP-dependent aminotransferase family protein [Deltaproteobacteria bacterium]|nr:PLP-dependent aminotransferase family protein [Deltaproteobacteria bacterium]
MALRLSSRAQRRQPSPIRELIPLMRRPGVISFGGGYPNPETFAFKALTVDLVWGQSLTLAGERLGAATQYSATEGLPALRALLAGWHEHLTGVAPPAPPMVLTGSQEGLYLVADVLLDEGDEVIVGEPTYPGALAAFRSFTERFTAIPLDGDGMRTDLLEALLQARVDAGERLPALIYLIPNGDNPSGTTLSAERRAHLAALAQRFEVPVLEDDPYLLLSLDGETRLPTIQSMAPEWVIRLDSFSKILSPGLRIGYASGPSEVMRAMTLHKQASTLQSSSFTQAILQAIFEEVGFTELEARVGRSMAVYRRNRDAMVEAARRLLPAEVRFTPPAAGMFLWLELPEGYLADRMIREDLDELPVITVPGGAFSTGGGLRHCVRASFSLADQASIEEGMRRLAAMIERERLRQG